MHDLVKRIRPLLCASIASLLLAPAMVFAQNYDASLERGARPDTTPQQRYQTAIREAGGGLKLSLADCRKHSSAERQGCENQARATYKQDMEKAREMKSNPNALPYQVQSGPLRMTETPIKP